MAKRFLVGIGGIGMQGLAQLYLEQGDSVVGSDIADFPERSFLEQKGAKIYIGHDPKHLDKSFDSVVYSAAIPEDNPELSVARSLGLRTMRRSEALGELMRDKIGIAVAGTHGKTTTSTMITQILERAHLSPTTIIGAEVRSIRGCAHFGEGPYMVVEACEYGRAFLDLVPQIAVITNIEPDHLDYYKDFDEIKQVFRQFIEKLPKEGLVIACGDDPAVREVVDKLRPTIFYGEGRDNDLVLKMGPLEKGKNNFSLRAQDGSLSVSAFVRTPGVHIALDAAAAAALAWKLGIGPATIAQALMLFGGIKRRFETIYQNQVTLIDDYGHHPTEIEKTLSAARKLFRGRRLVVVFQPHQLSRTRLLLADFAKSFQDADLVLIAPIWAVRDKADENQLIKTEDLVQAINRVSNNATFFDGFPQIADFLKKEIRAGDVILTLGAAKTAQFAQELKRELSRLSL